MGYARSPFGDCESYLRIVAGLDKEDFHLILKQFSSLFVTYILTLGIYTNKDIAEAVYTTGDHEGTLQIKYDDVTMKTKLVLNRFGSTFGTLRLKKNLFFILY